MNQNPGKGYFLNGKKQVVELLKYLEGEERQKLLRNMRLRNAAMTKELSEQCFSFKDLMGLSPEKLAPIMSMNSPAIIGLALYLTPRSFQRKALSSMPRDKAEEAFSTLMSDLSTKNQECLKAQNRIVESALSLMRRQLLTL